jgi:demethylmenaquinone methyltransferase/2-methoxy-6-polyprenyl-1,4-benzoquinol methylase
MSSEQHEANRRFYDRISRAYDLIAEADEHKARETGERLLTLTPGERVLEIGFGTGNRASLLEKTYIWMHRHFPHIVDCRPIDPVRCLCDAGFTIRDEVDMDIWTMPVKAVVGVKA